MGPEFPGGIRRDGGLADMRNFKRFMFILLLPGKLPRERGIGECNRVQAHAAVDCRCYAGAATAVATASANDPA